MEAVICILEKIISNFQNFPPHFRNKDRETIEERRKAFEKILEFLIYNKIGLSYLSELLSSHKNLPYYGKVIINDLEGILKKEKKYTRVCICVYV